MTQQKTFICTGSSGFLGTRLAALLTAQGHELTHVVRRPAGFKKEILWDFCSPLSLDMPRCDGLIHLASNVSLGTEFPPSGYLNNTWATHELAKWCRSNESHMIFASSIAVHQAEERITPETQIGPDTHYGMSKYLAEQLIRRELPDATVVRIAGIYGLDGPAHLGLNTAITKAIRNGLPPILNGPGSGRRNYIGLDDAAAWFVWLALNPTQAPRLTYMASDETLSIREYLATLERNVPLNRPMEKRPGNDCGDCLVEPVSPPVSLIPFEEYIKTAVRRVGSN
ncbi:NAD(P)-dependent oxidoreductase [Pseudodesulfovibrio sp.]|nr:NAD(P)-dependent oxidoreductase [Pseudodesulfovibrio sp.]